MNSEQFLISGCRWAIRNLLGGNNITHVGFLGTQAILLFFLSGQKGEGVVEQWVLCGRRNVSQNITCCRVVVGASGKG